jgi:hypothetical protein
LALQGRSTNGGQESGSSPSNISINRAKSFVARNECKLKSPALESSSLLYEMSNSSALSTKSSPNSSHSKLLCFKLPKRSKKSPVLTGCSSQEVKITVSADTDLDGLSSV